MSPTFHISPIPFRFFLLNIYTFNAPSPTLTTVLDQGIGMVSNKCAFLTYPPPHSFPLDPLVLGQVLPMLGAL